MERERWTLESQMSRPLIYGLTEILASQFLQFNVFPISIFIKCYNYHQLLFPNCIAQFQNGTSPFDVKRL